MLFSKFLRDALALGASIAEIHLDGDEAKAIIRNQQSRMFKVLPVDIEVAREVGDLSGVGFPVIHTPRHMSGEVILEDHLWHAEISPYKGKIGQAVEVLIHVVDHPVMRDGKTPVPRGLGEYFQWKLRN